MKLARKLFLTLVVIFLFFSLTKNFFDYRKNLQFFNDFKNNYTGEEKKNVGLKTQILKKSDINEVEKTIRNKLNLNRENETTILVPEPTIIPSPTPTPFVPVYQKWLNVFFK